jgi:hypothetical protein
MTVQTRKERNYAKDRIIAGLLLSAFLAATTATARAQVGYRVTKGTVAGVAAVIAGVGVGRGLGVYFAVRHNDSLTGCAVSNPNGLQLQSKGDQQTYALVGDISGITSAERIGVSGNKERTNTGASRQFLVEKSSKDYGFCAAAPGARQAWHRCIWRNLFE